MLEKKKDLSTISENSSETSTFVQKIKNTISSILYSFLGKDRRKDLEFREELNFLSIIAHSSYTSLIELDKDESISVLWQSEKIQNYGGEKVFEGINKELLKGYLMYSRLHPNEAVFTNITIQDDYKNVLYLTLKYSEQNEHYYIHFVPSKDTYTSIKNDFDILLNSVKVRDFETASHQTRVTEMSVLLSKLLTPLAQFNVAIDQNFIDKMRIGASLHDVGKIGIPENILFSPNKLTPNEMAQMKEHCKIGANMIGTLEEKFGSRKVIDFAKNIALCHHERWNGTGYPYGLKGEQIPLSAQIVAIIDVFDALMSERPYKKPLGIEEVREILKNGRGSDFNPEILDIFLENFEVFLNERKKYNNN